MFFYKAQRAVAVALAVGLLGAVALSSNGDVKQSRMKRSRISMTLMTMGNPSAHGFTFVNKVPGQPAQNISLPSLGMKTGEKKTINFSISGDLASMVCVCANGDDAWAGRLAMFKEDETEFGRLNGTMLLSTDDEGFYTCQIIRVDSKAKKIINQGYSETCEFPIPRTLGEMAESSEESAFKLEELEKEGETRGTMIVAVTQQVYSHMGYPLKTMSFAVESYPNSLKLLMSQLKSSSMKQIRSTKYLSGSIIDSVNDIKRKCNIKARGSNIFRKVRNLVRGVSGCVKSIGRFTGKISPIGRAAIGLANSVENLREAGGFIYETLRRIIEYGDGLKITQSRILNRMTDFGKRLSSVNDGLKETQSETASALRGFAEGMDELKNETEYRINEVGGQTQDSVAKIAELTVKVGLLMRQNEAMKETMAQQIKALSDKVDELRYKWE